mgnify:CR=1 FL=1
MGYAYKDGREIGYPSSKLLSCCTGAGVYKDGREKLVARPVFFYFVARPVFPQKFVARPVLPKKIARRQ